MKYRVESISHFSDGYSYLVEFTDKRNTAMERSWDYHMFLPHYGIVANVDTGKVEYEFGNRIVLEGFSKQREAIR